MPLDPTRLIDVMGAPGALARTIGHSSVTGVLQGDKGSIAPLRLHGCLKGFPSAPDRATIEAPRHGPVLGRGSARCAIAALPSRCPGICGLTRKQSYADIFICAAAIPVLATSAAIVLGAQVF